MENNSKLKFQGEGSELFGIYLVNILLTAITLGIYSFWARVKVTRFIFQNTTFDGQSFDYHATGKEKLIGFLKGILIIGAVLLIHNKILTPALLSIFGFFWGQVLASLVIWGAFIAAMPILMVGSRRFLLSRTSYRSLRFRFTGEINKIYKELVTGLFLSVVTLGFYYPTFMVKFKKFMTNHSFYGNEAFEFDAKPEDLLMIYLKGFFFTILTFGIYSFWFQANTTRFFINHTRFQGQSLKCDLRGESLFGVFVFGFFVTIFTLGIGMPWVIIKRVGVLIDSISYEGTIDFAKIEASYDEKASALADGISEAADALGDIAGSFS